MASGPYATGTVTVENGSAAVAGSGVAWLPALVVQGDVLWVPSLNSFSWIESVDGTYANITLYGPWSGGNGTNVDYVILPLSWLRNDPSLTQSTTRQLLAMLAGAGVIYYVSGASPDPGLASTAGAFAFKITASGQWQAWTAENGAWVYLGSAIGLNWLGAWQSTESYTVGDGVTRLGQGYIATQPSTDRAPEASQTATVTISIASPGVVTWNGHGLSAGLELDLSTTGALPSGLAANTGYYVVNPATDTFELAATPGGTPINTSGSQSGVQTATVSYWDVIASGGDRYDLAAFVTDRPGSGETILQMVFTTTVTFEAGLPQSEAVCGTAGTASAVFSLQKNGVQFGTLTYAANSPLGSFAAASTTTFNAGDVISVVTPSPRDATLADLAFTLTGSR